MKLSLNFKSLPFRPIVYALVFLFIRHVAFPFAITPIIVTYVQPALGIQLFSDNRHGTLADVQALVHRNPLFFSNVLIDEIKHIGTFTVADPTAAAAAAASKSSWASWAWTWGGTSSPTPSSSSLIENLNFNQLIVPLSSKHTIDFLTMFPNIPWNIDYKTQLTFSETVTDQMRYIAAIIIAWILLTRIYDFISGDEEDDDKDEHGIGGGGGDSGSKSATPPTSILSSAMALPMATNSPFRVIKNSKVTFKDIVGQKQAKADLNECIGFFKDRTRYLKAGYKIPRGMLLVGGPGVGKTLLAKAYAGEANVSFISACGADFNEVFVGVGSKRVRELFAHARKIAPCIIFIDEIDAIGRSRSKHSGSEHSSTLNKLLAEMDGFGNNEQIMVLAATNMSETLDPALVRSGRFDKEVVFDNPNVHEREELFTMFTKKIQMCKSVTSDDILKLAKKTAGLTGADVENICNQSVATFIKRTSPFCNDAPSASAATPKASSTIVHRTNSLWNLLLIFTCTLTCIHWLYMREISGIGVLMVVYNAIIALFPSTTTTIICSNALAAAEAAADDADAEKNSDDDEDDDDEAEAPPGSNGVCYQDLEASIDDIMIGMKKPERILSPEERRIVAYHEAGHAIIAYMHRDSTPPIKISMVPRGKAALGFTQHEPKDQKIFTHSQLLGRICVLLGGRGAEQLEFNQVSSGASDDIERLTSIARRMVTVYGMSAIGPLNVSECSESGEPTDDAEIQKHIKEIILACEKLVADSLQANQEALGKLAEFLLVQEVLSLEDMTLLMENGGYELENTISSSFFNNDNNDVIAADVSTATTTTYDGSNNGGDGVVSKTVKKINSTTKTATTTTAKKAKKMNAVDSLL